MPRSWTCTRARSVPSGSRRWPSSSDSRSSSSASRASAWRLPRTWRWPVPAASRCSTMRWLRRGTWAPTSSCARATSRRSCRSPRLCCRGSRSSTRAWLWRQPPSWTRRSWRATTSCCSPRARSPTWCAGTTSAAITRSQCRRSMAARRCGPSPSPSSPRSPSASRSASSPTSGPTMSSTTPTARRPSPALSRTSHLTRRAW
mmetsp:Transcript_2881/g.10248  ORF Transcript_2881/g.10248 Transcript_2881/m.10248 type:complete len:202 (-) Transcript_2881:882-1487(-)